jgi:Lipase (class 3).
MTGHSLGTAIASLAYANALLSENLCQYAILRDAYLFATPIICDRTSRMGEIDVYSAFLFGDSETHLASRL